MGSVVIPNGDEVGTVRPINMAPYFEQAQSNDARVKWTPATVAEALHRIAQSDKTKLKDVQDQFAKDNDVKDRQARKVVTKISDNENSATHIQVNGEHFEYWYSKAHKTAPIVIHRKKL
jgi:succinylarginine dihydrolase